MTTRERDPVIDERRAERFYREVVEMAPHYAPEWVPQTPCPTPRSSAWPLSSPRQDVVAFVPGDSIPRCGQAGLQDLV